MTRFTRSIAPDGDRPAFERATPAEFVADMNAIRRSRRHERVRAMFQAPPGPGLDALAEDATDAELADVLELCRLELEIQADARRVVRRRMAELEAGRDTGPPLH